MLEGTLQLPVTMFPDDRGVIPVVQLQQGLQWGYSQCLLLKVLHVIVDVGQNWWQVVDHSHTINLLIDIPFKEEISGGEAQPGNLVALDILTQSFGVTIVNHSFLPGWH